MSAHSTIASDDEILALQRLEATVARAFNDKDVDALMSVYARGKALFVYDVVGPPGVYLSWDAYREAFKHFFGCLSGQLRFSVSDLEIEVSGDVGYSRSLQHVSGVSAADGEPLHYTVRVTDVYRKINGTWLIVQEHVSLPIDRTTRSPMLHVSLPTNRSV